MPLFKLWFDSADAFTCNAKPGDKPKQKANPKMDSIAENASAKACNGKSCCPNQTVKFTCEAANIYLRYLEFAYKKNLLIGKGNNYFFVETDLMSICLRMSITTNGKKIQFLFFKSALYTHSTYESSLLFSTDHIYYIYIILRT